MKLQKLEIPGLILITPDIYRDGRGFFLETFRAASYKEILGVDFVQDNMSFSSYGTIRGLHYQRIPHAQAKLVRCVWGRILDVAVDLRAGSNSFGRHASVELDGREQRQFFLPAGFAHGFAVLSMEAIVEYKCNKYYEPTADAGLRYDDPRLSIDWQIPAEKVTVSPKDAGLPNWEQIFATKED
ncbi:MAG: dTDP-4-dehydrorhamnose 3,5-epimerase [Candidatus Cloacimonetes bacterium]|nr:dTDP-4-dehydrorhamnose 3,5-epimerase [Candidatus Cloacimonadota bacterium]MDY0366060.1 dTDP-4-dehydrorhamnose 3,5-epimerase [Candidatus Syntrophosphaera sp.]